MLKVCLATLVLTSTALADPWHVEPSVLIGVENFDYHEDAGPGLRSAHHGNQATTRLEVFGTSPNDRWFARAWFGLTNGTFPFDGTDQQGNPIMAAGDATGHMTDSELEVGYRRHVFDWLQLGGYLGFGRRTWDRDLRPIGAGGYREDYAWWAIPLSAVADVRLTPQWTASFEVTLVIPVPGNMRLHLSDFDPSYSDLDVKLDNRPDPRLRLSARYEIGSDISLVAEATYEESRMLQGPGTPLIVNGAMTDPVLYASEPETHTRRISVLAGASYQF